MRMTPRLLFVAAGLAVVSAAVVADTIPTAAIPESFLLGHAAPADTAKPAAAAVIEKSQAVNGALYAVVAPVYMGTGGTNSYIRAFNGGATAVNFSFTVVGSPSGITYGIANVSVPSRASPQLNTFGTATAPGIFDLAGVTGLRGSDTGVSVYIQSIEPTAGYQHVTFNTTNFFFENASVCAHALHDTIKSVVNSQVLTNIHTSLFPTYPAQVTIHNYASAATTYTVYVISATTGVVKGTVNVAIPANSTVTQPMTYFETQAGWTPSSALGELHANLVVTNPTGVAPQVMLGQSVINQTVSNALVNMGQACAVNAPVVASGGTSGAGDSGGFGGGGISY